MYSNDLDDLIIKTDNLININPIRTHKTQTSPMSLQRSYRKIRPEPINEKTLVGSVVHFIQDYVGTDKQTGTQSNKQSQNHNKIDLNVPNEVKEQIEWLHFEPFTLTSRSNTPFTESNIILVLGYKTGYSIWSIDLNGIATEALSVREPNINQVKLIQVEKDQKLLLAVCKYLIDDDQPVYSHDPNSILNFIDDDSTPNTLTSGSSGSMSPKDRKKNTISIVNLFTGECIKEIVYNGEIIELKSNSDLLCVNSFNRIDAFDLVYFEHKFSIDTCYSQISNSTGKLINPIALGSRWIAFADNKYHGMLASLGGVTTDIEQTYTAFVLNTAKSISKGLVKISESVVNSVVSKSKTSSTNSTQSTTAHSPRLNTTKKRHDSKDEPRAGICTIIDTKKFTNTLYNPQNIHNENQNWIIAHFLAHQEPIYALEFNPNGRLLVTADSLGQYFNVFQLNINSFKCTRTHVKHLYSLYRGDTGAKVRDISFSIDSRWLAIGTKRGTTHIFPINVDGGPVNTRTHSRPFVANRNSKHQRTSGFLDSEVKKQEDAELGYINNNPKIKHFLEPFIIPAYGQLKQPNANSSFQSSVISSNSHMNSSTGLLDYVQPLSTNLLTMTQGSSIGGNLAASALQSAALVTENVSNLASNTTNMIQYDNVQAVSVFAESRGYFNHEDQRDSLRRKPVNSLFVISDANGTLVEYVLDVLIDPGKNSKPSNDSPIMLKITPKAQWPLNRYISSDEVPYPILGDNPLAKNLPPRSALSKQASYDIPSPTFVTASSMPHIQPVNNDWIKMIEVNTHLGPHRRLFMGPQFQFKTFNSSLSTCMINAGSSSVLSDSESGSIDLSGDIELNSLDLSTKRYNSSTLPMSIRNNFDTTPTFIEIGAGSFQEGMPIMSSSNGSRGSLKSLNQVDLSGDKIIESLADAMNELNPRSQSHGVSPAIAISGTKLNDNLLTINPGSSVGSTSSSLFTVGSYFMINQGIPHCGQAMVNTSLASCTSSSSASSSNGHNDSGSSAASSFNDLILKQRSKNLAHFETGMFNDENLIQ